MSARAPISVVLGDMLTAAGTEHLTLDWLLGRMGGRSFRLVLLLLSIFGLLPGVSALAAVLLMIPAIQMLLARSTPAFPRRLRSRRFEARRLAALLRYVVAGTPLAGAFRSSALDDASRGDQARRWGQRAAVERRSSCSGATEQRSSRACDHDERLRLSGRGRRITMRCIDHRSGCCRGGPASRMGNDERRRMGAGPPVGTRTAL